MLATKRSSGKGGALAAFLVAFGSYSNSLHGEFVFDDTVAIVGNDDVQSTNATNYTAILTHDFWGENLASSNSHKSYRPVTVLTFRWNFLYDGLNVYYYHLVNVVLNALVCLLVHIVSTGPMTQQQVGAGVTALLFAVHPVHTEAVSGTVGRAELLASFFGLLAFLCYWKATGECIRTNMGIIATAFTVAGWLASTVVLMAVSFYSKETGITVYGTMLLYEWLIVWPQSRQLQTHTHTANKLEVPNRNGNGTSVTFLVLKAIRSLVLLVGAGSLLYVRQQMTTEGDGGGFVVRNFRRMDNQIPFIEDPTDRVLTIMYTWVWYARLLMLPDFDTLSCDYSYNAVPNIKGFGDLRNVHTLMLAIVSVAILVIISLPVFNQGGTSKIAEQSHGRISTRWLCVFWFAVPFLPAANILFYPGLFIAERVLYLPSMGFCLLVGEVVQYLCSGVVDNDGASGRDRDEDSMESKKHNSQKQQSRRDPAIAGTSPLSWSTQVAVLVCVGGWLIYCAGVTYARNEDWQSQTALFKSAMRVVPGSAKVQLNAGINEWHVKRYKQALQHYQTASEIEPDFCQVHYWTGRVHLDQKQYGEASARFQKALECREQDHDRFARDALETMFREFLKHHPNDPDTHSNLANILTLSSRFAEGSALYERALALRPNSKDFMSNWGYCLFHQNKLKKARKVLQSALAMAPTFILARSTLAKVNQKIEARKAAKQQRTQKKPGRKSIDMTNQGTAQISPDKDAQTGVQRKSSKKNQKRRNKQKGRR